LLFFYHDFVVWITSILWFAGLVFFFFVKLLRSGEVNVSLGFWFSSWDWCSKLHLQLHFFL